MKEEPVQEYKCKCYGCWNKMECENPASPVVKEEPKQIDDELKGWYKGKSIEEMTKIELIKALKEMSELYQQALQQQI